MPTKHESRQNESMMEKNGNVGRQTDISFCRLIHSLFQSLSLDGYWPLLCPNRVSHCDDCDEDGKRFVFITKRIRVHCTLCKFQLELFLFWAIWPQLSDHFWPMDPINQNRKSFKKKFKKKSESETRVNQSILESCPYNLLRLNHTFIIVCNQISDLNSLFPKSIFTRLFSESHWYGWDICIQKDFAILSRDYVLEISSSDLTFIGELTKVLQKRGI